MDIESAKMMAAIEGSVLELADAIQAAGAALADAREGLGHLTCAEIQPMIDLLALVGMHDLAARMESGHATGDDDPADMHYATYVLLNADI